MTTTGQVAAKYTIMFVLAVGVILSPVFIFVSPPQVVAASTTDNSNRVDSSNYHSTPKTTQTYIPSTSFSSIPTAATSPASSQGNDFTTQAALSSLTARPTNNIVNTNSFYDVVFLTASSGAIKTIQVTFPVGTTIPSGAFFNEAEGIGPGTVSKSGQTITYTVNNAVNVPAGTKIRLEFANINNPLQVSASYTVTVTTRDAANAIIDGPTQSTAYTIKQIGTNAIADSSITSTKPNEGFMKRVTLLDNTGGHDAGWDPNGALTDFVITEPAITDRDTSFVTIWVSVQTPVCRVIDVDVPLGGVGEFQVRCDPAPVGGAQLHYVVENLPAHVSEP